MTCKDHVLTVTLTFEAADVGITASSNVKGCACECFVSRKPALSGALEEILVSSARAIAVALGHKSSRPPVDITGLLDGSEAGLNEATRRIASALTVPVVDGATPAPKRDRQSGRA